MNTNDLKNFVISNRTQKYDEINKKILKIVKIYFTLMKNYFPQISINENQNNKYNINENLTIKKLLENQNNIIKELVKIINDILLEKINNEVIKKYERQSLEISDDSLYKNNIFKNKNLKLLLKPKNNINKRNYNKSNKKERKCKYDINKKYINNKTNIKNTSDNNLISKKLLSQKEIIPLNIVFPKTGNDFNGTLSFLNINTNSANLIENNFNCKNYDKYLNSNRKIEMSPTKSSFKQHNNTEINYYNQEEKEKEKLQNVKKNYIHYYNNYTIDEEGNDFSNINERQTSITSHNNIVDECNYLPELLSCKKKRIKYRTNSNSPKRKELNNDLTMSNIKNKNMKNKYLLNQFQNSFFDKNEDFSYKKRSRTTFNFFKSNLLNNNNDKKYFKTRIYSVPYINNGKINSPSYLTKALLNSSYKILNKYTKIKYTNPFEQMKIII